MDTRTKCVFLSCRRISAFGTVLGKSLLLLSLLWPGLAMSEEQPKADSQSDETGAVQVIKPEVKPREVKEAAIDDESFEVGLFLGVLNIDNFGSEPVYGVNAAYHATEDFFLQLNYGVSEAGLTSFEDLSGENVRLLTDEEREYTYYDFLVGYNVFPGEIFMTSKRTFNSAIYLVGGIGNTKFGGEDNFTVALGTGYRIVFRDWLSWFVDFRDHMFDSDIVNESELTHNLQLSTGVSFFF
jgi:outer membrane beta-barrel protein